MTTPVIIDAYLDELLGGTSVPEAAPAPLALVPSAPQADVADEAADASDDAHAAMDSSSNQAPPVATVLPFAPRTSAPAAAPAAPPAPTARATPARPAAAPAVARPGRWLRVCIGDDRYAVELLRVQEVVRVMSFVAMRGAEPWVLGVMNLRGRIVPVIDMGVWLDAGHVIPDERSRIVVVERNDELIGLLVTAVNDVATLDATHIEPPLSAGAPGPIVGVARAGDAPTVLLDANSLFA